jgi:transcription initiation factor TFIIB
MNSSNTIGKERIGEWTTNTARPPVSGRVENGDGGFDERDAVWQSRCPECDGRVRSEAVEWVCAECGLVVLVEDVDLQPTLQAHAPTTPGRIGEWAVEPVDHLRVDKGLVTTFFLGTDGKGNSLSARQRSRMGWLKARHKRFTMADKRDQRLNEGFHDIRLLGANLGLPPHVLGDAARYLKAAKEAWLPGGRMAWESLAGGAVLLACRETSFERTPAEVAEYTKTDEERVCAAARKIRTEAGLEAPVVRERAVDLVVEGLEEVGVDLTIGQALELVRVADGLMDVADAVPVGPGTSRMTVAGAAVYAADRLTAGKWLTQDEVVAAVGVTLPTSKGRIALYAGELVTIAEREQPAAAQSVRAD